MLHFIHELIFGSGSQFVIQAGLGSGLIGGAISLGSGIYSLFKGAAAGRRARSAVEDQNKKYGELANWYESEGSKDFLDTDAASSVLGKLREQYKAGLDEVNANGAKGGATAEASVATKSALNSNYDKALNNLVGYGTQYKENMHRDYGGMLSTMANNENRLNQADVNRWNNSANNSFNALSDTLSTTDWKQKGF